MTLAGDLFLLMCIVSSSNFSRHSEMTAGVISAKGRLPIIENHFFSCCLYWTCILGDLLGKTDFMYLSVRSANVCLLASAWLKYLPSLMLDSVFWIHFLASVFLANVAVWCGQPLINTYSRCVHNSVISSYSYLNISHFLPYS